MKLNKKHILPLFILIVATVIIVLPSDMSPKEKFIVALNSSTSIQKAEELVNKNPQYIEGNIYLGEKYNNLKQYDKAIEGKTNDAIKMFNKVLKKREYNFAANYNVALCYKKLANKKMVQKHLQIILRYSPDNKEYIEQILNGNYKPIEVF